MYGGLTPTRHLAYSIAKCVSCLNLGTLVEKAREALSKHAYQSATKYASKSTGKRAFAGSKFFKQTQNLGLTCCYMFSFYQLMAP